MNFSNYQNLHDIVTAISNKLKKKPEIFYGTEDEWNALTTAEKKAYDYWSSPETSEGNAVPEGGTTGQVLAKASDDDFDMEWQDPKTNSVKMNTCRLMPVQDIWEPKTWSGLPDGYLPNGNSIWTDGENIYLSETDYTDPSASTKQYILDKKTSTWNAKIWNGYTTLHGMYIWTDGDDIYFSRNQYQYVLDKATNTWSAKTWNGQTNINGSQIWTDGENIYFSGGNNFHYVLDKATSTWNAKTWNGYTNFDGRNIWTDGENIYLSRNANQYVLDKDTDTWNVKTWNGVDTFYGYTVWTNGKDIYLSKTNGPQYILDKDTSTWNAKTWIGCTNAIGDYIWTDGENIYFSNTSNQYVLNKKVVKC